MRNSLKFLPLRNKDKIFLIFNLKSILNDLNVKNLNISNLLKISNFIPDIRSSQEFPISKGFALTRKEPAGFTLVEIMVAISILAIIGVVSIPNLRGFNDNQILQNTTNDLVRILRQAQSSANSHTRCTNSLIAKDWDVKISSSNYFLKANCYDPNNNNTTQTDGLYSPAPASINGVSFLMLVKIQGTTPFICTSATVSFSAEYKPYDENRFSNISFGCGSGKDQLMEIQVTRNTINQYICLNKGGAIYASLDSCF